MPSCSEGVAGSVLTSMSAGMIPIVSKECGFEDDEVIHLQNCSMECIEEAIKHYSQKDLAWIKNMSKKSIDIVNERYSEKDFIESVKNGLNKVLN